MQRVDIRRIVADDDTEPGLRSCPPQQAAAAAEAEPAHPADAAGERLQRGNRRRDILDRLDLRGQHDIAFFGKEISGIAQRRVESRAVAEQQQTGPAALRRARDIGARASVRQVQGDDLPGHLRPPGFTQRRRMG